MSQLALLGGKPLLSQPPAEYRSIGEPELEAVVEVMKGGSISAFYGSWGDQYFGGPRVQEFEKQWSRRFGCAHTVSVNSATSGLFAAVGAAGVGPGDEVIVPPYTMSATAMAPLIYGGIPVFADIDPDTFCLSLESVERQLTDRTRAILAVNLFGHPAPLHRLRQLADQRGIVLIEDNAQGPLAKENGRYAGTIGHIGVFSLNYHKHIHTGEGGMCCTDSPELARRLQMIRNHGENAVEALEVTDLTNLVGYNYRLTELQAAIGLAQLQRVDQHVGRRQQIARFLSEGIRGLDGLTAPLEREGCEHVYYLWGARFDEKVVGVSRDLFSRALAAEGFPHFVGYVRPLYHLPIFQKRVAIGSQGFPFNLSQRTYPVGLCPVTERMHYQELLCYEVCAYDPTPAELAAFAEAFHKVYKHRAELAQHAHAGV